MFASYNAALSHLGLWQQIKGLRGLNYRIVRKFQSPEFKDWTVEGSNQKVAKTFLVEVLVNVFL